MGQLFRINCQIILTFSTCVLCGCGANSYAPSATSASTPYLTSPVSSPASECQSLPDGERVREAKITEIAQALRGGDFKKQEFEKTEEFKARLASRVAQAHQKIALNGKEDKFYFSITIPAEKIKYDADQNRMVIGDEIFGLLRTPFGSDKGRLTVFSSTRAVGSYVGENSFGVKKQITRSEETRVDILVPGGDYAKWPANFKPVTLSLSPDEAKKMKDKLVVLFSARLTPPYYSTDKAHFSPKIDAPFDITTQIETVHLNADCAVIYDTAGAKVLAPLSLAGR